jgi:CDP-paratose 2-epimerase
LTGPAHSGVELHGFLNYLVLQSVRKGAYTMYGYKGKQVRDQIHSYDVINALWHFAQNPRAGEVYNLGGGKPNSASLQECIKLIEKISGFCPKLTYTEAPRAGDHICYYSDMRKFRSHFPSWSLTYSLEDILTEMVEAVLAGERSQCTR